MRIERTHIAFVAATGCGAVLWIASAAAFGRSEPWDSALYWKISYPIAIGLAGVLGYVVPEKPWRWALMVMLSQFATMALKGGLGSMWPLGLVLFVVLALPGMGLANLTARIRTRREKFDAKMKEKAVKGKT